MRLDVVSICLEQAVTLALKAAARRVEPATVHNSPNSPSGNFLPSFDGTFSKSFTAYWYVRLAAPLEKSLIMLIVPLAIGITGIQASIYDVPGGYRAVMFDRFSGVRNIVSCC